MYENLELDLDLKLLFMALYGHIINLELNLDLKLLFMALYGHIMKVVYTKATSDTCTSSTWQVGLCN